MVRWVGFFLLCSAGTAIGLRAKRAVTVRVRALYALGAACEQMQQAIAFAKTSPSALFRQLREQPGVAAPLFAAADAAVRRGLSPGVAWQEACERAGNVLALQPAELAELKTVGTSLTSLPADAVRQALGASAALFLQWARAAESVQKNEERLRLTVWITAALLLGILFV